MRSTHKHPRVSTRLKLLRVLRTHWRTSAGMRVHEIDAGDKRHVTRLGAMLRARFAYRNRPGKRKH